MIQTYAVQEGGLFGNEDNNYAILDKASFGIMGWFNQYNSTVRLCINDCLTTGTVILSAIFLDNCSKTVLRRISFRLVESTLLQRDPSFACAHALPPLPMNYSEKAVTAAYVFITFVGLETVLDLIHSIITKTYGGRK